MSTESNKEFVRQWLDLWSKHGLDALSALVTDDYVHHGSGGNDVSFAGFKSGFAGILRAFPDMHYTVVHLLAENDLVAVYLKAQATQSGALFGLPPSGKHVTMRGVYHCRVRDGRICEDWDVFDMLTASFRLGAVLQLK